AMRPADCVLLTATSVTVAGSRSTAFAAVPMRARTAANCAATAFASLSISGRWATARADCSPRSFVARAGKRPTGGPIKTMEGYSGKTAALNVIDDHVYPSCEYGRFVWEMSDRCLILAVPTNGRQSILPMNRPLPGG